MKNLKISLLIIFDKYMFILIYEYFSDNSPFLAEIWNFHKKLFNQQLKLETQPYVYVNGMSAGLVEE